MPDRKMQTYISLLRGINVSGQKMIKMAALKKMYEDLKFMHVQNYIQSGNVVFQASETTKEELETLISNQIKSDFGFEVPVLVLYTTELKEIMEQNPFALDQNKDSSSIYITFLSSKPGQIDQEILRQKQVIGEEFILTEKAVYLYCPNGYGKTKLTNTFFENKINGTNHKACFGNKIPQQTTGNYTTAFSSAAAEREGGLKVSATTRNWKTVNQLLRIAENL